ncbi:MAG: PEP/pyruvate-binding domain-containing protein [Fidelibacterota bacterium]
MTTVAKKQTNFQDLMLYRIHEILLVASPYDAFIIQEDGRLTQQILYEYLGMNLSYAPRVWHAQNGAEALERLSARKYDLVIVMMRIADMDPISFGAKVKKKYPKKPVVLLAFDESEIKLLPEERLRKYIDKIFIWSGNANVFPAIIKYIEDIRNLKRDYKIADIRAILFIEDNPRYYSVILPLIYRVALKHARNLVNKSLSDTDRLLVFRARPKIIILSTYEEAIKYYKKYRHNILGIISDVRYPLKGKLDPEAGMKLTKFVKENDPDMPIMLQSTNQEQAREAKKLGIHFLHKDSKTLLQDLEDFIVNNFGFGDLVFRDSRGREIGRATDLVSLKKALQTIPRKTLEFHASRNHFSNWLAARGEFDVASQLRPIKVHQFKQLEDLRGTIIAEIERAIQAQHKGQIVQFSDDLKDITTNFIRISTGSLGGKARGLAFANTMLDESGIRRKFPDVQIRIPRVAVIGTDEFDRFMNDNNLWEIALTSKRNSTITKAFLKAELSKEVKGILSNFLSEVKYPLAVRSSSLLEDSQYQPLAGMYATFMLPNTDKHKKERLQTLCQAIKLIYASTYYQEPKSMIENSAHRMDEEKMGIIIMELVGKRHENRFYPTVSGLAQSYNYYPTSYMKREEGVAFFALGFGRTIVDGEKALRFAPKYPRIIPQYYSVKSTVANSQNSFYALKMDKKLDLVNNIGSENLVSYSLEVAETDQELHWAASVVCEEDNKIRDSLQYQGIRVITFPSLLKWNLFPLPEIISELLELGKQSLGCPVEIEFAVNLYKNNTHPPDFCLLQIKPMPVSGIDQIQDYASLQDQDIFCRSEIALGNGIIDNIQDILFINPETFDPAKTVEIAREIGHINSKMNNKTSYLLIGPGRWGSADPWLGIPVNWNQISKARVILELGMKDYPIDPSFGSHFFQNVTSMRIGYFTIDPNKKGDCIDLDWLLKKQPLEEQQYTKWFRLNEPLFVNIDGQTGAGLIVKPIKKVQPTMDEQESSGI